MKTIIDRRTILKAGSALAAAPLGGSFLAAPAIAQGL